MFTFKPKLADAELNKKLEHMQKSHIVDRLKQIFDDVGKGKYDPKPTLTDYIKPRLNEKIIAQIKQHLDFTSKQCVLDIFAEFSSFLNQNHFVSNSWVEPTSKGTWCIACNFEGSIGIDYSVQEERYKINRFKYLVNTFFNDIFGYSPIIEIVWHKEISDLTNEPTMVLDYYAIYLTNK